MKALLPDLPSPSANSLRRKFLQLANMLLNISVSRIQRQMKVIGHQNERDQLAISLPQRLQLFKKYDTVPLNYEDLRPIQNIPGNKMERARQIFIAPFSSP